MRVLALADDVDSVISEIRLRQPLTALSQRSGWKIEFRSMHGVRLRDLIGVEALVMQRGMSRRALGLQDAALRQGAAVLYDIDDLMLDADAHLSVSALLRSRRHWIERCIAEADVVTVTTPHLGEALAPYARCIRIVPNFAPPGNFAPAVHGDGGRATLIVASSERLSAAFLLPVLRTLAQDGTRLVAIGPPGEWLAAAGVPVEHHPVMPRESFLALSRNLPNPVALIPLEATTFAACKSAIKWFDFSAIGVPVICSNVSPYQEVIQDDVTGALVCNDAASWARAIQRAIRDQDWRSRIATAARHVVQATHTLDHTVNAWDQALREARARRAVRTTPARRPLEALWLTIDDLFASARRLNRQRLARRKASRTGR